MDQSTESTDALQLVLLRNAFYKKKFHFMLGIAALTLVVIIFLCSLFMYLLSNSNRPLYFVANDDGILIQESSLDLPFPIEEVNAWTIAAIEAANSFDYVNYRTQLQDAQKYFSDTAWMEYMKGLTASLNLNAVIARREVWISKVIEPPVVTKTAVINGAYVWRMELIVKETRLKPPLYLNTPSSSSSATYKITVVVQRKPLLQSYKGLAVLTMIKELTSSAPRTNIITPTR
jgi:intracellular multiplication protein IcmL